MCFSFNFRASAWINELNNLFVENYMKMAISFIYSNKIPYFVALFYTYKCINSTKLLLIYWFFYNSCRAIKQFCYSTKYNIRLLCYVLTCFNGTRRCPGRNWPSAIHFFPQYLCRVSFMIHNICVCIHETQYLGQISMMLNICLDPWYKMPVVSTIENIYVWNPRCTIFMSRLFPWFYILYIPSHRIYLYIIIVVKAILVDWSRSRPKVYDHDPPILLTLLSFFASDSMTLSVS